LVAERVLLAWRGGHVEAVRGATAAARVRSRPARRGTQVGTVEKGGWRDRRVEPVVIPATMGLDKGVWYRIRQGIRGLVAHDERGWPRVYVICEPSSHYYQIKSHGSRWMPVLIDERI
jgi:hypothetical protein